VKLLPTVLLATACLSASQQPASGSFDANRAFAHLKALVDIGPRPSGSPGAAQTRDYISQQLSRLGLKVEEQAFDARTPLGTVRMVNLRAMLPGRSTGRRLIVAGHYDTKLFRDLTFVGANDGGSSTAFLIELARALTQSPPALPTELLFFDGEEAVVAWEGDDNTYGSRHYVRAMKDAGTLDQIGALVLVDMIGERNPRFPREAQSTPWLTDIIWNRAAALGRREFVDESLAVSDDHLPFLEAGVPAVDIIDFDYPAWHKPEDTLDKVSGESLRVVGEVVLAALPEIAARISGGSP
jgi:glutaminyl-peptide cyclotransferase